jgi:hypothetical protein
MSVQGPSLARESQEMATVEKSRAGRVTAAAVTSAVRRAVAATPLLLLLLVLSAELTTAVLAQCAMCKASVAGAEGAAIVARNLNLAVLFLLIPPVTIFCAIFFMAYKHKGALREPPVVGADLTHAQNMTWTDAPSAKKIE